LSAKGTDIKLKKMKKLLFIFGIAATVTLSASCAKTCVCTTTKNGNKYSVRENKEVKYFDKSTCKEHARNEGNEWEDQKGAKWQETCK